MCGREYISDFMRMTMHASTTRTLLTLTLPSGFPERHTRRRRAKGQSFDSPQRGAHALEQGAGQLFQSTSAQDQVAFSGAQSLTSSSTSSRPRAKQTTCNHCSSYYGMSEDYMAMYAWADHTKARKISSRHDALHRTLCYRTAQLSPKFKNVSLAQLATRKPVRSYEFAVAIPSYHRVE